MKKLPFVAKHVPPMIKLALFMKKEDNPVGRLLLLVVISVVLMNA